MTFSLTQGAAYLQLNISSSNLICIIKKLQSKFYIHVPIFLNIIKGINRTLKVKSFLIICILF